MNNPSARFTRFLNDFQNVIIGSILQTDGKTDLFINHVHENNGRTSMFQLQALARIRKKLHKDQLALDLLEHFKMIEDAIGKYDYWKVYRELNSKWALPLEILQHIEKEEEISRQNLLDTLSTLGYIKIESDRVIYNPDTINNLRSKITLAEQFDQKKEKMKLLKFFCKELEKIQSAIVNNELDLNQIEEGVHEFRRKARWLGIYSSALLGKVRLSSSDIDGTLSEFLTPENENVQFNQLPFNNEQISPLYFLRGGFYALSTIINEIGTIKDKGLATEEMVKLGSIYNISKTEIKACLGSDFSEHNEVVSRTKELIEEFLIKKKILIEIKDYFQSQL